MMSCDVNVTLHCENQNRQHYIKGNEATSISTSGFKFEPKFEFFVPSLL